MVTGKRAALLKEIKQTLFSPYTHRVAPERAIPHKTPVVQLWFSYFKTVKSKVNLEQLLNAVGSFMHGDANQNTPHTYTARVVPAGALFCYLFPWFISLLRGRAGSGVATGLLQPPFRQHHPAALLVLRASSPPTSCCPCVPRHCPCPLSNPGLQSPCPPPLPLSPPQSPCPQ